MTRKSKAGEFLIFLGAGLFILGIANEIGLLDEIQKALGEGSEMKYRSLEQQIKELWASRGMEVTEEQFESIGKNKFKWTIIARKEKEAKTV